MGWRIKMLLHDILFVSEVYINHGTAVDDVYLIQTLNDNVDRIWVEEING